MNKMNKKEIKYCIENLEALKRVLINEYFEMVNDENGEEYFPIDELALVINILKNQE